MMIIVIIIWKCANWGTRLFAWYTYSLSGLPQDVFILYVYLIHYKQCIYYKYSNREALHSQLHQFRCLTWITQAWHRDRDMCILKDRVLVMTNML